METTIHGRFALVQDDYELRDWQSAADLLTGILGLVAFTAKQVAKKSRGYLAVNVPADLAQRLRDGCVERGIGVQLVPQGDVIPPIKPVRVHRVGIAEGGLCVRDANLDVKTPLGWDSLRLIAVTKTMKKETFRHWETMGGDDELKLRAIPYTEDLVEILADVFAFQPNGDVFGVRIVSRELNYAEALGSLAPDNLVDANARVEGFRLLLVTIAARARQAYVSPESAALLTTMPSGAFRATRPVKLKEFEAFNRWFLQKLRLKESQQGCGGLR
jgi:hypothetical protein